MFSIIDTKANQKKKACINKNNIGLSVNLNRYCLDALSWYNLLFF